MIEVIIAFFAAIFGLAAGIIITQAIKRVRPTPNLTQSPRRSHAHVDLRRSNKGQRSVVRRYL